MNFTLLQASLCNPGGFTLILVKRQNVLIAAGGTGGHLLPAQLLAEDLAAQANVLFAGHGLAKSPFFNQGRFDFQEIQAAPLRLSISALFRFGFVSCKSLFRASALMRTFAPDAVVGFGSFHVFPILAAATLLKVPLFIFEANCQMGKVNRLFSPFAKSVAGQFPFLKQAELVPLLPWGAKQRPYDPGQAKQHYGLAENQMTFLVFGGSQGALFLNRTAPKIIPPFAQVIHLTGKEERVEEVRLIYAKRGIQAHVKAYEPSMHQAYAAADFAICRSGAGTVAELIEHNIPSLLIPYPYSTDGHQIANARFLAKNVQGAIMVLEEQQNDLEGALSSLVERADTYRAALKTFRNECAGRESLAAKILRGL